MDFKFDLQLFGDALNLSGNIAAYAANGTSTATFSKDTEKTFSLYSDGKVYAETPTDNTLTKVADIVSTPTVDDTLKGTEVSAITLAAAYTDGFVIDGTTATIEVSGTGMATTPFTIGSAKFTVATSFTSTVGVISDAEGAVEVTAGELSASKAIATLTLKEDGTSISYAAATALDGAVVKVSDTDTVTLTEKSGSIATVVTKAGAVTGLEDGTAVFATTGEGLSAVNVDANNMTLTGANKTITVTAKEANVTKVEGLVAEGTIASVPKDAEVVTASLKYTTASAVKDETHGTVTVNEKVFMSGDTTGGPMTIKVIGESDAALTAGTMYLNGKSSKVATDGSPVAVAAVDKTDITVKVSGGTVTVGDLDNGDSFTVAGKTYSVTDGVLKDSKGVAVEATKEQVLTSTDNVLEVTVSTAGEVSGAKIASNVNGSVGEAIKTYDVKEISFKVSGGGLTSEATVTKFNNNDYLHKDGTVGSSSTDAVGQFKYNSTTGVITYTPTDKTKAQTINFQGDPSSYKFNVSGTNAADTITGKNGEHTINGGSGNDTIEAGESNTVIGGAGNDSIVGAGKGSLNGGAGNDILRGADADTLVGSDGADTFVLNDGTAGYGFISDYKLDQNDVILDKSVATQAALRDQANTTTNFGVTGALTFGSGKVTLDGSKGYYAVNVKAADDKTQLFGWAGEKATKIEAGSLKDAVILLGNTNSEADSLYGGSGDDTIFAGAGDVVYGAAGKNVISLHGGTSDDAVNTVGVGKGKDTIYNFVTGFDSEKADKMTIVGGLSSIGSTLYSGGAGANLELKSGDAAVTVVGASNDNGVAEVLVNGKKAVFAAVGAIVKASSATYADFYLGSKASNGDTSILDASAIEESVSIDLSNTNVFRNFNQVTGGKGKTTLIGTSGNDTLTAGEGTTSLYGGAGKDVLVGSSSTEVRDTFFMMAGAGSDTISNFTVFNGENVDTADIVNFSAIQSAKHVTGGAQINVNDTDKVLIENVNVDDAIGYQVGNSINAAKLGDVSNENNFTYLNGVNYYGGGNKVDTLAFTSGDSDNHQIWLDGRKGVSYASVDVVDGSNSSGDLILAGDSAKNTIIGGAGSSSLWGGAGNTADVLTGNGSKNTFFYGLAEGNDTITCGSENDLVNLYNIGLSDVSKAEITDSGVSLEFIDGSKVSVDTGYRDVKFALKDGSTWTANHNTHQWNS